MNCFAGLVLAILALCVSLLGVHCTELTFELEDNARQCFYEHLEKDAKGILEFQVRSLRQLGVVMLLGPCAATVCGSKIFGLVYDCTSLTSVDTFATGKHKSLAGNCHHENRSILLEHLTKWCCNGILFLHCVKLRVNHALHCIPFQSNLLWGC